MTCPVKNDSWKRLVKYMGDEDTAYKVYRAHGGKIPTVPTITQIKNDIKFKSKTFMFKESVSMNFRIKKYNDKHGTSHSIKYTQLTPSSKKSELVLNFFPRSVSSIMPKTKVKKESSDVRTESYPDPSDVFISEGNQYIVGGEVFASYEDAERYAAQSVNRKNRADLLKANTIPSNNISSALSYIEKNSTWEYGKTIAKIFNKYSNDAKIEVLDNGSYLERYSDYNKQRKITQDIYVSAGVYLPDENTILIRESSDEKVLLHEIAHAMSMQLLHNESSSTGKQLDKYFNHVKSLMEKDGMNNDVYGLKDKREFISEILTDPNFINLLKSYPPLNESKYRNAWKELVDFFAKLFGIEKDSLYNEALEKVMEIIDEQDVMNTVSYNQIDPAASEELSEGLQALTNTFEKLNNKLLHKSKILARSSGAYDAGISMSLSNLTDTTSQMIEDGEYSAAVVWLIDTVLETEVKHMVNDMISHREGRDTIEPMNSTYINKINDSVELYNNMSKSLLTALDLQTDHPELRKVNEEIGTKIVDFMAELSRLAIFVDRETKSGAIDFIKETIGDELDRPAEQMLENIETDINQAALFFGTLGDSPDQVMRAIYKAVTFQKMDTDKLALKEGKELYDLQEAMENAGYNDMSVFHEKHNGKKTGYMISSANWGEYFAEKKVARKAMFEELKQFGYENLEDLPHSSEMTDAEKAVYDKHMNTFHKEWDRQIEGSWYPNPKRNREFDNILNTPELWNFYYKMKDIMTTSREKLPQQYSDSEHSRLLLPQVRRNTMEVIKSRDNVIKGLGIRVKEQFLSTDQDVDFGADTVVEDIQGNPAKLVPIHYATRIEDTNDLSDDITSMTVAYLQMADKFKGMSERLEDIKLVQRSLEGRKFTKGKRGGTFNSSNISKMLENYLDQYVYNIKDNKIEVKIPGTDIKVNITKTMNSLLEFVRTNNLFASISAISGGAKTTADYNMDKIAKKHVSFHSHAWAEKEIHKNMSSIVSNIGKRKKSGKFNIMMEYNGVVNSINEVFDKMNIQNKALRMNPSDLIYFNYTLVDMRYRGLLALGVYDDFRLVDGKFITSKQFDREYKDDTTKKWEDYREKSLYNAYEVTNGKFQPKPEYKKYINNNLENTVRYTIEKRGAVLTGQLSPYDRPQVSRNIMGKFLMLHRNWMVSGVTERFKKTVKDDITGEMDEGYYRSAASYVTRLINGIKDTENKISAWESLDDFQKHNVRKFIADLVFSASILILSNLLLAVAEDEPDEYWINFLSYTLNRIRLEQMAFMGIKEPLSILDSPTAAKSVLDTAGSTIKLLTDWEKIEYGSYDDMYRFERALIKNSMLKNIWEMKNIDGVKQKNKFIVTQVF